MQLVNLRTIRIERRLSQKGLGERIKVPQTVISQIERGVVVHDRTLIAKLAKALKVDPSKLSGPPLVDLDDANHDGAA
jgi:transcriptional regulator with XRE-family HTH domain